MVPGVFALATRLYRFWVMFAPMKQLALLWSFYLIILSCIPCSDENLADGRALTSSIAAHADHPTPQPDLCSPLCGCSCCGSSAMIDGKTQFPPSVASAQNAAGVYPSRFFAQPCFSFWQPPKV